MKTPRSSLVGRLVLSFLVPTLVILVVVVLAYSRANDALKEAVFEKLDAVAAVKEAALDAWIDHLYKETVLVSEMPEIAKRARTLLDAPAFTPESADARRDLARLFQSIIDKRPSITEIFLLAPTGGQVMISTEESNVGEYRIYDRYYVAGKWAPFIQNVYPSPVTLRPNLTISAPVRGNTEAVAWSLYRDYLLPFEIASIFLLVAMMGAVILGRRN